MSRTTLSLFGAARAHTLSNTKAANDGRADAYRAERLAGLTPVERALVEPQVPAAVAIG